MPDPTSDLTFRPQSTSPSRRDDAAWEAVVREELLKLRRRTPHEARVVPASRPRLAGEDDPSPPTAG
jgi:hypothetical protein